MEMTFNTETGSGELKSTIDGIYANILNIEHIETVEENDQLIKKVHFKGGGLGVVTIDQVEKDCQFTTDNLSMQIKTNDETNDTVIVLWDSTVDSES